jgi:pterin-4a-carbinolamine dehydratase
MIRVASLLSIATTSIQAFHNIRSPLLRMSHRFMVEIRNEAAACSPGGKCLPCESLDKSHLLSPEQIQDELARMKLWSVKDGNKISRSFTARNFQVSSPSLHYFYVACCILCALVAYITMYIVFFVQCAMDSLVDIGKLAERENHHPDMHLTGYRNVEICTFIRWVA